MYIHTQLFESGAQIALHAIHTIGEQAHFVISKVSPHNALEPQRLIQVGMAARVQKVGNVAHVADHPPLQQHQQKARHQRRKKEIEGKNGQVLVLQCPDHATLVNLHQHGPKRTGLDRVAPVGARVAEQFEFALGGAIHGASHRGDRFVQVTDLDIAHPRLLGDALGRQQGGFHVQIPHGGR